MSVTKSTPKHPFSYKDYAETDSVILERDWFQDAFRILETQRLLMLVGKPGSSKTTCARLAATRLGGRSPIVLQGSPEIEQQHVWGYERLVDSNLVWGDGFLPRALKRSICSNSSSPDSIATNSSSPCSNSRDTENGQWLIIEDFNQIPLDVRAAFMDLRDNRASITNPLNGEEIQVPPASPHDLRFRLVATANPESMKCNSNRMIAQSLFDGFVTIPEVPPIGADEIEKVLRLKLPHASDANIEHGLAEWKKYREIRATSEKSDINGEDLLTYRAAEQLVQLLETGMQLQKAVEFAIVSKFVIDKDLYSAATMKLNFE